MRLQDLALRLLGATSGEQIIKAAAAASGAITLPAGTTDFSATGGTSQVVRQSTAGGAFTVGQLAASDVSGALSVSGVSGMTAGQIPIAATATTITSSGNLSGAVTTSGSLATTLANNAVATAHITNANVTYAKIQNVAANRLLGNSTGTAAAPAEIALPLTVALGGTGATTFPLPANVPTGMGLTAGFLQGATTAAVAVNPNWGTWGDAALVGTAVGSAGPYLVFQQARGTVGTQTATQLNDNLGYIQFAGYGTSLTPARGNLRMIANETWTGTAQGTRFEVQTTPNGGTTTGVCLTAAAGVTVGSPTGGDKGAGTLNAVGVYAQGTLLTSDARLKRDIEPVPAGCLELVDAIEPKRFRWAEPHEETRRRFDPMTEEAGELLTLEEMAPPGFYDRRNWGFTAQDIQPVLPDAVEEDAEGNLSYSPADLTAVLWRAVQELSAKVAALEGREPAA